MCSACIEHLIWFIVSMLMIYLVLKSLISPIKFFIDVSITRFWRDDGKSRYG